MSTTALQMTLQTLYKDVKRRMKEKTEIKDNPSAIPAPAKQLLKLFLETFDFCSKSR